MALLCLKAGAITATIVLDLFTLSWTHSVAQTEWHEDWIVDETGLHLIAARIKGSGAGMEMSENAVLIDGTYHFWPKISPVRTLILAQSKEGGEWVFCHEPGCQPLLHLLPDLPLDMPIELSACRP